MIPIVLLSVRLNQGPLARQGTQPLGYIVV